MSFSLSCYSRIHQVGLLFSLVFLVAHLSINPYVRPEDDLLAIISQFMLVALFFGGILLKTFGDLTADAGIVAARASMVFRSQDQIVMVLIFVTIAMVVLLVLIVTVEAFKAYAKAIADDKWGCCTVNTPTFNWDPTGNFCCFLSHYKMEAASDARYMHDVLCKMLKCPVYLDSSTLSDLR